MTTLTVPQRVANGVTWLDATYPTWPYAVSLKDFDISDECRCVLGQVFAEGSEDGDGFGYALNNVIPANVMPDEWAEDHGFDFNGEIGDATALQDEWTRVITARREARVPALV